MGWQPAAPRHAAIPEVTALSLPPRIPAAKGDRSHPGLPLLPATGAADKGSPAALRERDESAARGRAAPGTARGGEARRTAAPHPPPGHRRAAGVAAPRRLRPPAADYGSRHATGGGGGGAEPPASPSPPAGTCRSARPIGAGRGGSRAFVWRFCARRGGRERSGTGAAERAGGCAAPGSAADEGSGGRRRPWAVVKGSEEKDPGWGRLSLRGSRCRSAGLRMGGCEGTDSATGGAGAAPQPQWKGSAGAPFVPSIHGRRGDEERAQRETMGWGGSLRGNRPDGGWGEERRGEKGRPRPRLTAPRYCHVGKGRRPAAPQRLRSPSRVGAFSLRGVG